MRAPVGWDGCVILILRMACNPADLLEPSVGTCALERRWFWPAVAGRLWRWYCSVIRTHSHRQAHLAGQLTKATASLWLAAGTAERQRHLAAFDFFLFLFLVRLWVWVCVTHVSAAAGLPFDQLTPRKSHFFRSHWTAFEDFVLLNPHWLITATGNTPFRWDSHLSLWKHSSLPYSSVRVTWSPAKLSNKSKKKFKFTRTEDKGQYCYSNGLSK